MHFQKLYAGICVAALVGAISLNVQGADSDAQAKARELLRQKMAELSGQPAAQPAPPAAVEPAPAPVVPQAPATKAVVKEVPAPAKPMPAVVAAPAPMRAPGGLTPEQEEQVREAMRQEKAKLDATEQTTAEAAGKQKASATLAVKPKPTGAEFTTGNKDADSQMEKKMKEAAAKQNKDEYARAATEKSVAAKPAPVAPAPANLVPGSKEQRLFDLLQQYKADKVTPSEYHLQRAKILAE